MREDHEWSDMDLDESEWSREGKREPFWGPNGPHLLYWVAFFAAFGMVSSFIFGTIFDYILQLLWP